MTAATREAIQHPELDAALDLLWPGLGQLNQGRAAAGVLFALGALVLVVIPGAYPIARTMAATLIAALAVWSIVDVLMTSRRRSSSV